MKRGFMLVGAQVALCAALAIGHSASIAQMTQEMPTDTDLKAAYCLGVQKSELAAFTAMRNGLGNDPSMASALPAIDKAIQESNARIAQLTAYVTPKALAGDNYLFGLGAATNRGKADVERFQSDPEVTACATGCAHKFAAQKDFRPDAADQCTQQCAPPYTAKIRACGDLSWMPF